jgi:hypothetical protein
MGQFFTIMGTHLILWSSVGQLALGQKTAIPLNHYRAITLSSSVEGQDEMACEVPLSAV